MSFFEPLIGESEEWTMPDRNFSIVPFNFNKSTWVHDNLACIYDIPADVVVIINETSIPSKIFDYYNPLLVKRVILKDIEFFSKTSGTFVNNFICKLYLPGNLPNIIIGYPKGFNINYCNMTTFSIGKAFTMPEIMAIIELQSTHILPLNITMEGVIQMLMGIEDEDEDGQPYDGQEF